MTVKGNVSYAGMIKRRSELQSKSVTPSEETIVVVPDSGYDGLSKVIVDNVTAAVDPDIIPENIKEGVEILGVTGTMTSRLQSKTVSPADSTQVITPDHGYDGLSKVTVQPVSLHTKTVYPELDPVTYYPDDGYTGFSEVTVKAVTADIDPNIIPGNIKIGVNILGVAGTLQDGFETVSSLSGELPAADLNKIFKSITLPSPGTKAIGQDAFKLCTGLESITIPDSVLSVGQDAFYGCSSLADVYYTGTQEQWENITIDSGNDTLLNASLHCMGV